MKLSRCLCFTSGAGTDCTCCYSNDFSSCRSTIINHLGFYAHNLLTICFPNLLLSTVRTSVPLCPVINLCFPQIAASAAFSPYLFAAATGDILRSHGVSLEIPFRRNLRETCCQICNSNVNTLFGAIRATISLRSTSDHCAP